MIYYFGYGSLVNRATRPAAEPAIRARLFGYQRQWAHRVAGRVPAAGSSAEQRETGCTSLTIVPHEQPQGVTSVLEGVLVPIAAEDLPELDAREAGYDRHWVPISQFSLGEAVRAGDRTGPVACPPSVDPVHVNTISEVAVYRSKPENHCLADTDHPILQSYVDCVMAGYLSLFDESGLDHFLNTTVGWQQPITNDRAYPQYPRAVSLEKTQHQHFDALVARLQSQSGNSQ